MLCVQPVVNLPRTVGGLPPLRERLLPLGKSKAQGVA